LKFLEKPAARDAELLLGGTRRVRHASLTRSRVWPPGFAAVALRDLPGDVQGAAFARRSGPPSAHPCHAKTQSAQPKHGAVS
jgi:hypothetical protein